MPPQRTNTSSKEGRVRQRSSRACQPCRKRKIKCDGQEPCEACVGYGYDCVYVERQLHKDSPSIVAGSPVKETYITNENAAGPSESKVNESTYMATETLVTDPEVEGVLLRSLKTRFTSAYSAIAWPRALGVSLDMPVPPRLQSYAWNPGNRAEPKVVPQNSLTKLISLDEMKRYTSVFFTEVNPILGLVDRETFLKKSEELWILHKRGFDFESLTCGMVALGSYFSSNPLPTEAQVVEHMRLLLDLTVAHAPGYIAFNHIQAWVLRAVYLRCTTRPHLAWMASNTAIHLAEALGLHRDLDEAQMKKELHRLFRKEEANQRRKVFWIAVALNQFFAAETGRTRAAIEIISCRAPITEPDDLSLQTLAILQSIPKSQNTFGRGPELLKTLNTAMGLPAQAPFLVLLRADACFCTFRMLRSTNTSLSPADITSLLEVIQAALDSANFLVTIRDPWWNIVGTPFHVVCILLSLDTTQSLAKIPAALETLKSVTTAFDSHLSREALRTALQLVEAAREKRRKELDNLDRGITVVGSAVPSPDSGSGSIASHGFSFEWSMDNNVPGLSDFLDFGGYGFENDVFLFPNAETFAPPNKTGGL